MSRVPFTRFFLPKFARIPGLGGFWLRFCSRACVLCCAFASLSYEAGDGTDEACVKGWNFPEPPEPEPCPSQTPTTSVQRPFQPGLGAANCEAHKEFYACKEAVGANGGWAGLKRRCIFPFYIDEERFDNCDLFGEPSFIVPVWRCPVYNITRKYKDTEWNQFTKSDYENTAGLCRSETEGKVLEAIQASAFPTWIFPLLFSHCHRF